MRVWLIGMMGSGKSTSGELAARTLGVPFHDTDQLVADRKGRTVAEIWREDGEPSFRALEKGVVEEMSAADGIVSTGGGVVLDEESVLTMRQTGEVVWLRSSVATLEGRLRSGQGRPLLDGDETLRNKLSAVLAERGPLYAASASSIIDTDELSVSEVADQIVTLWNS